MPKIRRQNLPPALLNHLLARIKDRQISADQLGQLADWLDSEPEVPEGRWIFRHDCLRRGRAREDVSDRGPSSDWSRNHLKPRMESLALSGVERVDDIFGYDWGAQAAGLSVSAASRNIRCLQQQVRWR